MLSFVLEWINTAPIGLLAVVTFGASLIAGALGQAIRGRGAPRQAKDDESQEGYIVSGVLGLLSILLGFTLAIALDRFDTRRLLVVEEATAIGTAYLQAQLLGEPHRSRISELLKLYTDNRILLATAQQPVASRLLAENDRVIKDLWAATAGAFDSIVNLDFSSTFVGSVSNVVRLDLARKGSRIARVPSLIFLVLLFYIVTAAGVLGFVLVGWGGRLQGTFLVALLTLSLVLIIDLDRPTSGGLHESQLAMQLMAKTLKTWPSPEFDRWRAPAQGAEPTR